MPNARHHGFDMARESSVSVKGRTIIVAEGLADIVRHDVRSVWSPPTESRDTPWVGLRELHVSRAVRALLENPRLRAWALWRAPPARRRRKLWHPAERSQRMGS